MDNLDKATRSRIMSAIRSKNTGLEKRFRKLLWENGLGYYRLYYNLPGRPDIAYVSKRAAVFIDGDFWHGYHWKSLRRRLSKPYWLKKIKANIDRDRRVNKQLRQMGWRVVRIWEHSVDNSPFKAIEKIKLALTDIN